MKHGPNSHPTIEKDGTHSYLDNNAQSKINHFSKNQDTLILSSGIMTNENQLTYLVKYISGF